MVECLYLGVHEIAKITKQAPNGRQMLIMFIMIIVLIHQISSNDVLVMKSLKFMISASLSTIYVTIGDYFYFINVPMQAYVIECISTISIIFASNFLLVWLDSFIFSHVKNDCIIIIDEQQFPMDMDDRLNDVKVWNFIYSQSNHQNRQDFCYGHCLKINRWSFNHQIKCNQQIREKQEQIIQVKNIFKREQFSSKQIFKMLLQRNFCLSCQNKNLQIIIKLFLINIQNCTSQIIIYYIQSDYYICDLIQLSILKHLINNFFDKMKYQITNPTADPQKMITEEGQLKFTCSKSQQKKSLNDNKTIQKSLFIANYLGNHNQDQFLFHTMRLAKIFNLNIDKLVRKDQLNKEFLKNVRDELSRKVLKNVILKCQNDRKCIQTFTQYTRKTHETIFLLVNRFVNIIKKYSQMFIVSTQAVILHSLTDVIDDDFSRLRNFLQTRMSLIKWIVVVDLDQGFTNQNLMLSLTQIKSLKNVTLIRLVGQNAQIIPTMYWKGIALQKIKVVQPYAVYSSQEIQQKSLQKILYNTKEFRFINNFIINEMVDHRFVSPIEFCLNQFCNSIYSFVFNTIRIRQLLQYDISKSCSLNIQNVQEQVMACVVGSMMKFDHLLAKKSKTKMCFPNLFKESKKCFVCKKSKPKYGCGDCSAKNNLEIHLCVTHCFKKFHQNKQIYLENYSSEAKLLKSDKNEYNELHIQILNNDNENQESLSQSELMTKQKNQKISQKMQKMQNITTCRVQESKNIINKFVNRFSTQKNIAILLKCLNYQCKFELQKQSNTREEQNNKKQFQRVKQQFIQNNQK